MLTCSVIQSLADVSPDAWDALTGADNPFVEHAFLHGLECSGSVGSPETGWLPHHVLCHDRGQLVGALPGYVKLDSYGEFIFDWSWAAAAHQAGLPYYPKLVSAVPFTPATGPRILLAPGGSPAVAETLLARQRTLADACNASSIHVLFCTEPELPSLERAGLLGRASYQFHWHRDPAWQTFDDFLAALRAPSRKQVRKERAQAAAHGLTLRTKRGPELTERDWAALYTFYRVTVHEKGAHAYLTRAFFTHMQHALPERVLATLAYAADEPVAGALYLTRGQALFGRYWGCLKDLDALHFELCYYAPIEWALQHGVTHFEAGAQGEHKLKRGLMPSRTHSAHWLRHPGLHEAVASFLPREARAVQCEMTDLASHSPYRRNEPAP